MKVWMVNQWHSPWVGHGYEPVALCATREVAEAMVARFNAAAGIVPGDYLVSGEYDADEWEIYDNLTAPDRIPARDVIADALCRAGAGMPSQATFARADRVIAYLDEAGWRIVPKEDDGA